MKNPIINYLEQIKSLYQQSATQKPIAEFYEWILKEGKVFTKTRKPIVYGEYKQCFYNAQNLAFDNNIYKYFEGWGISKAIGIPLDHGFVAVKDIVIDPTWRDGTVYFGIHIPTEYIRTHWIKTKMAENLLYYYYLDNVKKGGLK